MSIKNPSKKAEVLEKLGMPEKMREFLNSYDAYQNFEALSLKINLKVVPEGKSFIFKSQPSSTILSKEELKQYEDKVENLKYLVSYFVKYENIKQDQIKLYDYFWNEEKDFSPYLIDIEVDKKPDQKQAPEPISYIHTENRAHVVLNKEDGVRKVEDIPSKENKVSKAPYTPPLQKSDKNIRFSFLGQPLDPNFVSTPVFYRDKVKGPPRVKKEAKPNKEKTKPDNLSVKGPPRVKKEARPDKEKIKPEVLSESEKADIKTQLQDLNDLSGTPDDNKFWLGQVIKYLRVSKGRSTHDFKSVNMASGSISRIELGKHIPQIEVLARLLTDIGVYDKVRDYIFSELDEKQIYKKSDIDILRLSLSEDSKKSKAGYQIAGIENLSKIYDKNSNLLGVLIKFLRLSKNKHQTDFSVVGLSKSQISKMEVGKEANPKIETIKKILNELKMSDQAVHYLSDTLVNKRIYSRSDGLKLKTYFRNSDKQNENDYQINKIIELDQTFRENKEFLGQTVKFLKAYNNRNNKSFGDVGLNPLIISTVETAKSIPEVENLNKILSSLKVSNEVANPFFNIASRRKIYSEQDILLLKALFKVYRIEGAENQQREGIEFVSERLDRDNNILGTTLKFLRLLKGLGHDDIQISNNHNIHIEHGEAVPDARTLKRILVSLKASEDIEGLYFDKLGEKGIYSKSEIILAKLPAQDEPEKEPSKADILLSQLSAYTGDSNKADYQIKQLNLLSENLDKDSNLFGALVEFLRTSEGRTADSFEDITSSQINTIERGATGSFVLTLSQMLKSLNLDSKVADHLFSILEDKEIYSKPESQILRALHHGNVAESKAEHQIIGVNYLATQFDKNTNFLGIAMKFLRISEERSQDSFLESVGVNPLQVSELELDKAVTRLGTISKIIGDLKISAEVANNLFDVLDKKEGFAKLDVEILRTLFLIKAGNDKAESQIKGLDNLGNHLDKKSNLLGSLIRLLRESEERSQRSFKDAGLISAFISIESGQKPLKLQTINDLLGAMGISDDVSKYFLKIISKKEGVTKTDFFVIKALSLTNKIEDKEKRHIQGIDYLSKHLDKDGNLLGATIRFLREVEDRSQSSFGDVGLNSPTQISQIENGGKWHPTTEKINKVLTSLKVSDRVKSLLFKVFVEKEVYSKEEVPTTIIINFMMMHSQSNKILGGLL